MLRLSLVLLLVCSIFLVSLLNVSQSGVEWEVSPSAVVQMSLYHMVALISLLISLIFFAIKFKIFLMQRLQIKITVLIWYALVFTAFLKIIANRGPIGTLRLYHPIWRSYVSDYSWVIIVIFLILSVIVQTGLKGNKYKGWK